MPKKTVAELFVETLALARVKRVYGVAGDSLNGITDAIRPRADIHWIPVRHEETAAFAAGAEEHLTGHLALCAGSCGPGNLHLINGLYDAHRSRVPVLAIAAHIPSREIGSGYFQETHPEQLFRECSHYCELVSHPEQMPRVLEIAVQTAVSRRGVSVVVLPGDIALQPAAVSQPRLRFARPTPSVRPSDDELHRLAEILNGVLKATITAAPGRVQLGDFAFPGFLYNGAYVPPLLRLRLGDTMRITFANDFPDDLSNLHHHGMSVSPQGNSDNVFVHVHPGQQFEYEVRIPTTGHQGPGFFWYHPHAHGFVEKQIRGGMSGGLVVEGSEQLFSILQGLPERFFLIKHAEIGEATEIISINGQINPTVQIRPGEMQFWRIGHVGAMLFIKFRIEGMPLYVVATDGYPLSQPRKMTEFFIGPGQRIDAIAIGPEPGEYAMRTVPFQNEAWRRPDPPQQMATIVSAGLGTTSAAAETEVLRQRIDGARWIDEVRSTPIARRRTLESSRTPDRRVFMIDRRVMDDDRVDQKVSLGDTEEWTVVNTDQQYHSIHIHQTAFLVTEVNGVRQNENSLRDTFWVPPATDDGPGILKVVIPFTDPVIVGRFVYHCHAVNHEDKGMMGIVEVVA